MIIRKITEVTETETTETFQLICHEKDEGWELTREEMEKLRVMTERSLEGFHIRRQNELLRELSNLNDEFQSKAGQIDKLSEFILTNIPGEPSRNEGAVDTAIRLLKERQNPDQAEECPDYIEPPAPEVVCENGVCHLVLPEEEEISEPAAEVTETSENLTKTEEKEQEPERKVKKGEPGDFSKYVDLVLSGVNIKQITEEMSQDMGIAIATATAYMYSKVRPLAAKKEEQDKLRAIEAEKKQLEKKIEKKIQVIPPTETGGIKPEKGKYFSDEERLRIQKKLGLK